MEGNWLSDAQQRVWRGYLKATATISTYLDARLRPFGLNLSEYDVLVQLADAPDRRLRMSDLAEQVSHSRSRLTHTISRLEKRGLVTRQSCSQDGRGVFAQLLQPGFELLVATAPDHVAAVRAVLVDVVPPEDFEALGRVAEAVVANHLKD